jgi:hypothetical protein
MAVECAWQPLCLRYDGATKLMLTVRAFPTLLHRSSTFRVKALRR